MIREQRALPKVLVFTSDIDFYLQVNHVLTTEKFEACLIGSVDEFSQLFPEQNPDVVILDNRIANGFASAASAFIRASNKTNDAPIIILTRDQSHAGADKPGAAEAVVTVKSPITPETLIERVKTCLGTAHSVNDNAEEKAGEVKYADLEMNLTTYRVKRGDRNIHLSPIEFKLLRHFLERPEQAVSRDELKTAVWKDRIHVEPRTVDVHVGRLRRALTGETQKDLIRTIRSVGYALYD